MAKLITPQMLNLEIDFKNSGVSLQNCTNLFYHKSLTPPTATNTASCVAKTKVWLFCFAKVVATLGFHAPCVSIRFLAWLPPRPNGVSPHGDVLRLNALSGVYLRRFPPLFFNLNVGEAHALRASDNVAMLRIRSCY